MAQGRDILNWRFGIQKKELRKGEENDKISKSFGKEGTGTAIRVKRKRWNSDVKNWRRKLEQRCKELEEEIGIEM
jgi:hypothetical protein